MNLGLRLATRALALPHESHCIQTQDINALIRQEQHHLYDFQKHPRVGPVQVPLVIVERRPDPAVVILKIREIARRIVWEDFDQRALVGVDFILVGEEIKEVLEVRITGKGLLGPFMLSCGMVQNKVDTKRDAIGPQILGQRGKV